jgi:hypothetical protein
LEAREKAEEAALLNRPAADRELKMIELKKRIKEPENPAEDNPKKT